MYIPKKLFVFVVSNCILCSFLCFLENWLSSIQLKDVWKIKGIVDEPDTCELNNYVELSDDDQEPTKPTSSYGDISEKEDGDDDDDNDESCNSDSSEVCGGITSNKFAALDVSD